MIAGVETNHLKQKILCGFNSLINQLYKGYKIDYNSLLQEIALVDLLDSELNFDNEEHTIELSQEPTNGCGDMNLVADLKISTDPNNAIQVFNDHTVYVPKSNNIEGSNTIEINNNEISVKYDPNALAVNSNGLTLLLGSGVTWYTKNNLPYLTAKLSTGLDYDEYGYTIVKVENPLYGNLNHSIGLKVGKGLGVNSTTGNLGVNIGEGLMFGAQTSALKVNISSGLSFNNSKIEVSLSSGLEFNNNNIRVKIGSGLNVNEDNALSLQVGSTNGLILGSNGLKINIGTNLYIGTQEEETNKVYIKLSDGLYHSNEGISIKTGTAIGFDSINKTIGVNIGQGLILSTDGSNKVRVSLGSGLTLGNDGKIYLDIANGLYFNLGLLSIRIGTGLKIDNEGLYVKIGTGLALDNNNTLYTEDFQEKLLISTFAVLPTALEIQRDKYYRLGTINSLDISLPYWGDWVNNTDRSIIYFEAGTSPSINITAQAGTGGSIPQVLYSNGYSITPNAVHEIEIKWNGISWLISAKTFS